MIHIAVQLSHDNFGVRIAEEDRPTAARQPTESQFRYNAAPNAKRGSSIDEFATTVSVFEGSHENS